jgi:hypothetical protein
MRMVKYLLGAGGVLLVIVLVVYLRPHGGGPMTELADLAERQCLVNVDSSRSAQVNTKLTLIKQLDGMANVEEKRKEARGAAAGLDDAIRATQDDKIRACMEPYGKQIIAMAGKL